MSQEEILRKERKPSMQPMEISSLALRFWNIEAVSLRALDSYDDCNYYLKDKIQQEFILKVYNGAERPSTIEGFAHLFKWLETHNSSYAFPTIVPSINNQSIEYIPSECGDYMFGVRMFRWIPGKTLKDLDSSSTLTHFHQVGEMLGNLTIAVQGFIHESFHRIHAWDLKQFDTVLSFVSFVSEEDLQTIIRQVHQAFHQQILPSSSSMRWACIHGDCNDANIIINGHSQITGLIDFGDAVYTWTVNDVATAMCYALLTTYGRAHPYEVLTAISQSYHAIYPLLDIEIRNLRILIAMRLSLSTSIGAYSMSQNPDDPYLGLHAIPAKQALRFIWNLPHDFFIELLK